jgi:large subunit ribosomal protein L29
MKINERKKEIKKMSVNELESELKELKQELFKLKFSLATNGLDNPLRIPQVRKDIARVNTEIVLKKNGEKE